MGIPSNTTHGSIPNARRQAKAGLCGGTLFAVLPCLFVFTALFLGVFTGCGSLSGGRSWGEDATLKPGWERVKQAAWHAATAPETWIPAAGALALSIDDDADKELQAWASSRTPVFGSQLRADKMSDALWSASSTIWLSSAVLAPSGDNAGEWMTNKAKGLGLEAGTGIAMRGFVGYRKKSVNLTSPNGADQDGYLSVHAAGASFYNTLASRHLEYYDMPRGALTASRIGLGTLTAATAWARVEADQHYPVDVFKSIAVGHFFGSFITDAFIGRDNPRHAAVYFEPSKTGLLAMVLFAF